MEHKLDDFFRKKIADAEDTLPETSGFDEDMFWGELQKNMLKPQPTGWWKWIAVAACLAGVMVWALFLNKPDTHIPEHNVVISTPKVIVQPETFAKAVTPKLKTPEHNPIKKQTIAPIQEVKPEIKVMAVRMPEPVIVTQTIKQDSIHFQLTVLADTKPKFKTVHVNEISKTENEAIPQPKFKIRFAARNLP